MNFGSPCLLLFVLLAVAVQPTASFDLSSIADLWSNLKTKIDDYIRGDGTITEEEAELLEKLNQTTSNLDDFHKRLEEMRKKIKSEIKIHPVNKTAIDALLKKISKKVHDHIRKGGDNIEEVNEKLNVTGDFYQGDMILTKEQIDELYPKEGAVQKRQAFGSGYGGRTWSTFYYSFQAGLPTHAITVSRIAIRYWQANTCVNFVESSTALPRVNFFQGQGCYSYVGNIGTRAQELSLGQNCDQVGVAAHEIGHALGFFHEQSRHDRDTAITVVPANIVASFVDQFNKESTRTNNNYGLPYDYGSIMQYAGQSVSRNGMPTMVAKVPQYQDTMGSQIISFRDISAMNSLYNCKARCPAATSAKCQNGGFPHPRNCGTCLCPSGYGGTLCNQRPAGCGAALTATATAQTLTASVGDGVYSVKDEFTFCNWMITAPAGMRIQATITRYNQNACTSGCAYGGVEMKWRPDKTLTGSRYCCPSDVNESVTTTTNIMPIIAFNRYGRETFSISYRAV